MSHRKYDIVIMPKGSEKFIILIILSVKGRKNILRPFVLRIMEEQIKVTKRNPAQPRCTFDGGKYIILERNCGTVRISNGDNEFCVGIEHIKPTNREARVLVNDTVL